jgi:hypothetical protein
MYTVNQAVLTLIAPSWACLCCVMLTNYITSDYNTITHMLQENFP